MIRKIFMCVLLRGVGKQFVPVNLPNFLDVMKDVREGALSR